MKIADANYKDFDEKPENRENSDLEKVEWLPHGEQVAILDRHSRPNPASIGFDLYIEQVFTDGNFWKCEK